MRVQTRPGQERRQALRLLGWVVGARTVGCRGGYEAPAVQFTGFLVVEVAAELDGVDDTLAHIAGTVTNAWPETVVTWAATGATTGSGTLTLDAGGGFAFDLPGLAYGVTTITVTATDSRSAVGADSVERVMPALGITAGTSLDTSTGITVLGAWTIQNAIGGIADFSVTHRNGQSSSVIPLPHDLTATGYALPWADGQNDYTFFVRDGAGRTAQVMSVQVVVPLSVEITTAEWWGFNRVGRVAGRVAGYYHTPSVAWSADVPNAGSGAVTIDANGNFDFTFSASIAGGTGITVTATEDT